ncbi:hypothetical protein SAMN05443636_1239 [Halobaculum gomorrense]|uniref:DUF357 domain-containing protein n=2 Tax=Halobaculum gomorrense TaxID=43928 RepID=A0A1M5N2Y5_9EURY|nr:hypothetical protein SAMN05443636_1239 [Halobaculum gomorrense]
MRNNDTLTGGGHADARMPADLDEKTTRYGEMLASALEEAEVCVPEGTPLYGMAEECEEMAVSYLEDGRHFREADDPVNALASYSYGYGWLDCGVRMGLFAIPEDTALFTTE